MPTSMLVYADAGGLVDARLTVQGSAIGVDGRGEVLVVWGEQSADSGRLRAHRFSRTGVPEGTAFGIDPAVGAPINSEVVTAGLAGGGWVVVWEASRSGTRDIVYRVVSPAGVPGAERFANAVTTGQQEEARVAAVGDGFVIVWTDATSRSDDPWGGIRARWFSATGVAAGGEILVDTDRSVRESRAQIASSGTRWAVLFHRQSLTAPGARTLRLRRFDGLLPRDSGAMQAAPVGGRAGVITALESGDLAIAWMTDSGDVYARVVDDAAPALVESDAVPVAMTSEVEVRPVIAPLGPGFVVAWEEGSPARVRFAADMSATLAPEVPLLAMELDAGTPPASVMPSPDGLWFAWTGYGFGTSAKALGVFHLPTD